jgi:hypothetical protein
MPDRASARTGGALPVIPVTEGDYVFRAGEPADSFFIVQSGQVELLRRGTTRERLALLDAGDLVGEDSAFEGQARACDARAISRASLLKVDAGLFADLVRVKPELATRVISRTALRLLQSRAACLALAPPVAQAAAPPPKAAPAVAAPAPAAHAPASVSGPRFVHVDTGTNFPFPDGADLLVGRADPRTRFHPEIELSSVDSSRSLSRRHARVKEQAGDFFIVEEPKVSNGTFLNGQRLTPGVAVALKDGDEVCFGLLKTVFRTT